MRIIILLGPPGSGKGTQAELLADKVSLDYLETAKIGEERIKKAKKGEYIKVDGKKFYFDEQRKLWERGKLWDPPFITYLIEEKIKEIYKRGRGIVFAGSPRTLYEGEKIIPLLKKLYGPKNIKIILLDISAKEAIFRNSHRRICQLMRHPILSTKKEFLNLKYCPLDGSKLMKRKGLDKPETIKVRLREYKERTLPLIELFKKQSLKVKKINGEQSVADVFKDILKAI
jgi:adenylate kinase